MIYENCDDLTENLRGQARISRIFDLHFGKVVKTALKVRKNDTFPGSDVVLCVCVFVYNFFA